MVQLIEDLESACIRFVHFSKENELRSRVFSEKMGLEAGWNCHISLLSEVEAESVDSAVASSGVPNGPRAVPLTRPGPASTSSLSRLKARHSNDSLRYRRGSAPGAINVEVTQVKFQAGTPPLRTSPPDSLRSATHRDNRDRAPAAEKDASRVLPLRGGDGQPWVASDELCEPQTAPLLRGSPHSPHTSDHTRPADTDPLLTSSPDAAPTTPPQVQLDLLEQRSLPPEETNENLSTSGSYHASSHFTENTDSVTGFGLTNRVRGLTDRVRGLTDRVRGSHRQGKRVSQTG